MPYALNAIAVDAEFAETIALGELIAEADSPARITLVVGSHTYQGIRYLIVSDDGTGYRSGMGLVAIPDAAEQPSSVVVRSEWRDDFGELLSELLARSPRKRLILYLEANRIISKPGRDEPFPVAPTVHAPVPLSTLLAKVYGGTVVEEEIFLVQDR